VLLFLEQAPENRLRMSELAASLLLSQSGITRLVDRLEREGLVVRERCDSDGRGYYAVLTAEGRTRFAEARPTHLAGVRGHFLDRLSERDLARLAVAWDRILPGASA
jgi:DNA-binding MarR family transcriptional regulator